MRADISTETNTSERNRTKSCDGLHLFYLRTVISFACTWTCSWSTSVLLFILIEQLSSSLLWISPLADSTDETGCSGDRIVNWERKIHVLYFISTVLSLLCVLGNNIELRRVLQQHSVNSTFCRLGLLVPSDRRRNDTETFFSQWVVNFPLDQIQIERLARPAFRVRTGTATQSSLDPCRKDWPLSNGRLTLFQFNT